jgi:hypothetical protein
MPPAGRAGEEAAAPGRSLSGPGTFAADDGSVPDEVDLVRTRWAEGRARLGEMVAVLARHRLLVPLLEVDADQLESDDADPCAGQDRAVAAVSLRTPEGTVGLAFTGMPALAAWDSRARPMPVEARRAASALRVEGAVALLVDPAGPVPCRIEGVALARLAAGGDWPDPWADPAAQEAVADELGPALAAGDLAVRLAPPDVPPGPAAPGEAPHPGLLVELRFRPGTPDALARQRAELVARRLSGSAGLRRVFDGVLAVRIVG